MTVLKVEDNAITDDMLSSIQPESSSI